MQWNNKDIFIILAGSAFVPLAVILLNKVNELSFEAFGAVEFYYTQENIKEAGLEKINTLIGDASFRKKINKVIEQTY